MSTPTPLPTERPATAAGPRPVTPVGIVAELLGSALRRIEALPASESTTEIVADLRRAEAIAGGLDPYLESHTSSPSPDLARLAVRTAAEDWVGRRRDGGPLLEQEMLSGHVEGTFLRFLVHATRARRVLEIGMFSGYSALAMAEALPDDGHLVACELEPSVAAWAQAEFARSRAGSRIEVQVGPALQTLYRLTDARRQFDLVFVDADKPGYADYLDALLDGDLVAEGGLICFDNTLLQGEPWSRYPSANGRAISVFNDTLAGDPRVEQVVVPLRDGVTLVRRVGG